MTSSRLTVVGRVLRHAMGVLLLCWLRALKWGGIAGLAGVLAAEIAAIVLTRSFPPDGLAQVVAFTLGAALAFGVAATVIADELVVGIIDSIRVLIGEAGAGARAARMAGRREVGQSSGRVLALFGLGGLAAAGATHRPKTADMLRAPVRGPVGPRDEVGPRLEAMRARVPSTSVARPTPTPTQPLPSENPWAATLTPVSEWPAQHDDAPTLPPPGALPQSGGLPAAETLLDVAGLASIAGVASTLGEANPTTQPLAQPVHATNLPRIGWATEDIPTVPPETASDERTG
ncbi:MAG TPA: hypothetical protein VGR57_03300, partial [Ktedonobacterales bacterium]|nr:hypothetical protein [Ktedonobacterales bacterium]